jgi:3D (Asp-Asp-Asp) domain-containing protein
MCVILYENNKQPDVHIIFEIQQNVNSTKEIPVLLIKAKVTAYNSDPAQTDNTPHIAAWNNKVYPGMVAVSRDLEKLGLGRGVPVYIDGERYTIDDRMHERKRVQFDIWMENKEDAKRWGVQEKEVIVLHSIDEIVNILWSKYPIKLNIELQYS